MYIFLVTGFLVKDWAKMRTKMGMIQDKGKSQGLSYVVTWSRFIFAVFNLNSLFMKNFVFVLLLMFGSMLSFGQAKDATPTLPTATEQVAIDSPTIHDVVDNTVQILTDNPNAEVKIPETVNPTDTNSLIKWWWFIYGLLMPIGTFIFNRFFPSSKKRELIIKSTSVAILTLVVLLTWKGYAMLAVMQGVMGFVMQFFMYDKLYNPAGLKSFRKKNYVA